MYAASRQFGLPSLAAPQGSRTDFASFTPLEERVIGLAASGSERPSTAVEPVLRRAVRRIANFMMARRGGHELADPRLEALRSYAAAVRLGRSDGLPVFHAAGYTAGHAETVKRMVAAAARAERIRAPRRERVMYASGISIGVASIAGFVAMTGTLLAGI
ncbi:hypothetical protein KX816_08500 [Sphingosinicellaceae bacterium]|nr:hypothetical protein KX816_08500 [Sphingosinicellaceae bacterium]